MSVLRYPPAAGRCFLPVAILAAFSLAAAVPSEERGDFWSDAAAHVRIVADGGAPPDAVRGSPVAADYAYRKTGDASIRADLPAAGATAGIALGPGPGRAAWNLAGNWTFRSELSFGDAAGAPACTLEFADADGKIARSRPLTLQAGGGWQAVAVALRELSPAAGFDFARVIRATLVFGSPRPARVWLDAVRFGSEAGDEIALTDKPTAARMAEEQASRGARIAAAFEAARPAPAKAGKSRRGDFFQIFADLWLDRDVAAANRDLLEILTTKDAQVRANYGLEYTWALTTTPMLYRFHFNFGRRAKRFPGRLTPEVERAILEELWTRNRFKNDIHATRQSTWNLTGSENHDINAKVGCLLTAQIFRDEPEFAGRVYPNLGTGPGYGYWFHRTAATGRFHGEQGRAARTDFGEYRAAEHWAAWTQFLKEYFRERARRGFFVERASPGYMKYTLGFIQDLHDYGDDAELKKLTGMFLDLVWAEWAQDQLGGLRGGAKTRVNDAVPGLAQDSMYQMATFLFGGPGNANSPLISFLLTDYRPAPVIWNLALNRGALGAFAYVSRTPGEEPGVLPRPPGMERTLLCDTDSRFVRYSWVTPDYILGTQMDHPLAIHSHLSPAARFHGMLFASTGATKQVFPRGVAVRPNGRWLVEAKEGGLYRSLQSGPVLITQQTRGFTVVNPDWFPGSQGQEHGTYGVYFSPGLARVEETGGWIFVEEGNAYLAVRIAAGVLRASFDTTTDTAELPAADGAEEPLDPQAYDWSPDRTILKLRDRHSPIVFEAGRRADYASLADFKRHILANRLVLQKHTVPGWYAVHYTSGGRDYYFNSANVSELPSVDGRPVDYAPRRTFDSPYLRGDYRRGVVTVSDGHRALVLDFETGERR